MSKETFKGFDKDLKCRDHQYEVGKEYSTDDKIVICENGYHSCENPLDVLSYYPPILGNRYCSVKIDGKIVKNEKRDSKVASSKIKINTEIGIKGLIDANIKFIFEKTKTSKKNAATTGKYANAATTGKYANAATTGDCANAATTGKYANAATTGKYANAATTGKYANAATTGDCANAATTGKYANAATTGDCANAATTGENSIAAGLGINNKAKSTKGNWIVLSEWIEKNDKRIIKSVKSIKVDGIKIKENMWYVLKNNKFVIVKEND